MTLTTYFEIDGKELLARAKQLEAEGYERVSVVDQQRADELAELYREIGREVVTLRGAVPEKGQECDACLTDPRLITLFVRKK